MFFWHIFVFPRFFFLKTFFFPNRLPRTRYRTYEDATWYGCSLGAILYFCIIVTLKGHGQGHSIKFKVQFKKLSEWSEKSSERLWRQICKFGKWPSPNYSRWYIKRLKMAYKWRYKLIRDFWMKTGIGINFLMSWAWKVQVTAVQGQIFRILRMVRTVIGKVLDM